MSNILTCGELKNVTFETYDNDNPSKVIMANSKTGELDEDASFGLQVHKKTAKVIKERDKNNTTSLNNEMRIKPGSKIIKINNLMQYNEMIEKFAKEQTTPVSVGTNSIKTVSKSNELLESLSKEYDGLYISQNVIKELSGYTDSITGKLENLRVFNSDIIATPEDKSSYSRLGEGRVSGSYKHVTSQVKEITSEVFHNKKVIHGLNSPLLRETLFKKTPTLNSNPGKNEVIASVKKIARTLSNNKLFKNLTIKTFGNSSFLDSNKDKNKIYLNQDEVFQSNKVANTLYKLKNKTFFNNIPIEESTKAYSIYEAGKVALNSSEVESNQIKNLHSTAFKTFDGEVMVDKRGHIIIPKKEAIKYFKEKAHMEKLAWQHAITQDKDNPSIRIHAAMELSKHTEVHMDIKSGKIKEFCVGDVSYKIHEE